jgi:oxygen-independent coproporphyrinogen-3 oxidase
VRLNGLVCGVSGIYVHIPFCRQSCVYCNFFFKTGKKQAPGLIEALIKELEMKNKGEEHILETLYFGGGTPSYVEPQQIQSIITKVKELYPNNHLSEITLEANPDDMTLENLVAWKAMGITRFSVGVQSFYDEHLQWMNRAHTAMEAELALALASEMGFELSIDLIFGIPNCSNEQWLQNLNKAVSYPISHLSCYGLTLEENTPWKKLIEKEKSEGPNEIAGAEQFQLGMDFMREKAWLHYEISNYCLPDKMAVHNTSYWQNKPYIGIGPSAHSYNGIERRWNVSDINVYVESIEKGEVPETIEVLSTENKYNEYVMTSLRTIWGCDIEHLDTFGLENFEFQERVVSFLERGLIRQENSRIFLTEEGKLYADAVASELFVE